MNILLIFVILFCSVNGSQKTDYGSNITSPANENLRQKISPELDEIDPNKSYDSKLVSETKGGALQRLLSSVTFVCKGRFEGYYADNEFGCQTFHYCKQNGLRFTFVCPPESIFNQKEMMCDHNVSEPNSLCIESHNYYYLNAILYAQKKEFLNDTDLNSIVSNENSSKNWSPIKKTDKKESPELKNKSKQTEESILPFKGFSSLIHKNNGSLEKWIQISPVISKTEKQKFVSESHENIKYNSNSLNISIDQTLKKLHPTKIKATSSEKSWLKTNASNTLISPFNNSIDSFHKNISDHTDWDDVETGLKLDKPINYLSFKPNFNEVVNPDNLNLMNYANTAPFPIPALPGPMLKPKPLLVLRPNYIPGTFPIATLYKQTEYMYGKPHIVHKGLYLNPNYGATIVNPQPMPGPQPFTSLIDLIPSPSDRMNSKFHKNSKVLSNFQNAFTKFSFNDIFSLKGIPLKSISPKRKGSEKSNNSLLKLPRIPTKTSFKLKIENPFLNNQMFFNERLSNGENILNSDLLQNKNFENNIPLNVKNIILLNDKPIDIKEMNLNQKSNKSKFNSKPQSQKYSLKIDETLNSKHIITQPSIFTNVNDDKRKKWIENYAKIKKKYMEREKKSQQNVRKAHRRKNSQTFDQKMYEKL